MVKHGETPQLLIFQPPFLSIFDGATGESSFFPTCQVVSRFYMILSELLLPPPPPPRPRPY